MTRGRKPSPTGLTLAALAAGLTIGIAISVWGNSQLRGIAAATETVGIIWINAIRMTVIPLVMSLLVVSVGGFSDVRAAGRMGGRTLMLFIVFMVGSAAFALLVVPSLFAWLPIHGTAIPAVSDITNASTAREQAQQLPTLAQWFADLVPTNPVRAAADGAMLPLVIFSILFGLACTNIAPDLRETLLRFFRAVGESMLTLVRWLIFLAPLGVFALILPLGARMGASAAGAIGYYVSAICGALSLHTLAIYPAVLLAGRVSIKRFAQAALPAQIVAISSRSSLASLPAMLDGLNQKLECPPDVSGFALPLAVSIFKINTPIVWLAGAIFLARLYGVPLGSSQIGLILAASMLLSFSAPGIPMGSLLLLAPLYVSVGLPVEGIGLLIAVDLLPDIFKTVSNVTGDMAVAVVLAPKRGVPA